MKLKQNIVMILVLGVLLGSVCLGIAIGNPNANKQEHVQEEVPENVIPKTFVRNIKGSENIPQEIKDVITNYMDDYFLSLYTLELQDTTKYFVSEIDGQVSDSAIKLIVESRKLYDFDFKMSQAYYDLDITQCINLDGKYIIGFLEDDYYYFNFLNGLSSEQYGIENSIEIEKVDEEYKISSYEKKQGYYMMFNDNKNDDSMSNIYDFYYNRLLTTIEDENYKKELALNNPYVASKVFNVKYDRDVASKYAQNYFHNRNEQYYDYSDDGGNCQNMASQALIAGGMIMDELGDNQWYYNNVYDNTSSWRDVESFNTYCKENEGTGIVCEVNANIYYAEPGDLIQVGISSLTHTCVVSKVVDGHILLNSNSIDMKDYPLEAYTYPVRKLIKILGSNS